MSNTCELRTGIVNFEEPKDIDRLWPKRHAAGCPSITLGHTDRMAAGVVQGLNHRGFHHWNRVNPPSCLPRQATPQGGLLRCRAEDAGESKRRPAMGWIEVVA
jgi:hypothetical protein